MASVVAFVCRLVSVMRTIRSSVVVQRDRVGMYMAIFTTIHDFLGG